MSIYNWQLTVIVLFALLGLILHVQVGWNTAWYLYAGATLLALILIFFGTVNTAYRLLNRGKVREAEKSLRATPFPKLLVGPNRTYYHLISGLIHLQHKDLEPGKQELEIALQRGIAKRRDQALAMINLAHIHYVQKEMDACRQYLAKVKALEVDDLLVREQVKRMEKVLSGA